MDQNNAKGRNFLKVTGILMIIGGAIGLILSIIALLAVGALDYLSGGAVAGLLFTLRALLLFSDRFLSLLQES